jgi:nucleoid DNA-binding protein
MMDVNELVLNAKAAAGKQLSEVPDGKAKSLIRHVFAEVIKQVEAAGGEPVRVPGLGVFRTNTIQREKDGNKTTVKRIIFRAAARKAAE